MRHICYALHLHKCLHPDSLEHHAMEKCHVSINTAHAGPWEEQEFQIPSTKKMHPSIHITFPWNTMYPLACLGIIWNITHAIPSPPFLLAHFQFSHPLSWHWKTGDLTNSNLALTVSSFYFCSPLLLLISGRATVLLAHLAGKQHLILQHNLAPALQIIASGEMAPAWQKTQSCNTEFTTCNTAAIQAPGQTWNHILWPPYAQCSCPEAKFLIKSYSSSGSGSPSSLTDSEDMLLH